MTTHELMTAVREFDTIEWMLSPNPCARDIDCIQLVRCAESHSLPTTPWGEDRQLSIRIQMFVFRMAELCVRTQSAWLLSTAAKALAFDGRVRAQYAIT
jgi:hypothetical protein